LEFAAVSDRIADAGLILDNTQAGEMGCNAALIEAIRAQEVRLDDERSELSDAVLYNMLTPPTRRFAPRPALRFAHHRSLATTSRSTILVPTPLEETTFAFLVLPT